MEGLTDKQKEKNMFIPTKSPWFKFFPRDFLYETKDMSTNETGIYMNLSSHYWIEVCTSLSYDEMKRILRGKCRPYQLDKFMNNYPKYFDNGRFVYESLDFSMAEAVQRSVNSRKANDAKLLKKLGKDFQSVSHTDTDSNTDTDTNTDTDQYTDTKLDTDTKSESSSTAIARLTNIINNKIKDK